MKYLLTTIIIWAILLGLIFLKGAGELDFFTMVFGSLIFAILTTVGIFGGKNVLGDTRKSDTGFWSCRNCGYVGGTSVCPKCGRKMYKIYSEK